MQLKDELLELRAELDKLRCEQTEQQQGLTSQLDRLSSKLDSLHLKVNTQALDTSDNDLAVSMEKQSSQTTRAVETVTPTKQAGAYQQVTIDPWTETELTPPSQHQTSKAKSGASTELAAQLSQSAAQLSDSLISLLGPLSGIFNQIKSFYQHYQDRGQGPVFLMTVAGIITLTLGFGYLLQYSINNWFSELGKALFGFASANAFIAIGAFIHKKRPGMQDFASSLVGLGLILNFLSAYFIGPYFGLIPTSISFILLFLITLAGFGISMRLETKVVSVISLVGGSLAPMMLITASQSPLLYLPYLLIIGGCALIQSRKLNWPPLMEITSLLHIACIEAFMLYLGQAFPYLDWEIALGILSISGIFYLYGFTGIYWLLKSRSDDNPDTSPLTSRILALPFALIALVLVASSQLTLFNGEVFLINSGICIGLFFIFRNSVQLKNILLVFAGSFAGFAALNLVSHEYLGLVLLLEGLLLLWLGAKERLTSVRAEAYVLLALGLLLNISGILNSIDLSPFGFSNFDIYGFTLILLLLTTATIYSIGQLLQRYQGGEKKPYLLSYERQVLLLAKELVSVGYTASLLFIAALISYDFSLNFIPLISLLLLYLAARDKLKFTELFAWLLLLPLLLQIGFAILETGSFSFRHQALYAQIARVELFASLILAYYWYKRHFSDSKLLQFAGVVQLVCYICLPLLFIPKVIREYGEYISLALWLSCFISLFIARVIRHRALIFEAKILTLIAISSTALSCLEHQWQGLIALTIGAIMMSLLLVRYQQLDRLSQRILIFQWQLSPFYFGLVTAVLVQSLVGIWLSHWGIVAAVLSGYFAWLISLKPIPAVLKSGVSVAYGLTLVFAIAPLLIHKEAYITSGVENLLFCLSEAATLGILAWLVLNNGAVIRAHKAQLPLAILHWGWHLLLGINYMMWSYQLPHEFAAPISAILLVIHGCALMFISLNPKQEQIIKLAGLLFALACFKVIFIDMANFEIIQKVVAFMVIGAILLSVSYFYQRARNQQN